MEDILISKLNGTHGFSSNHKINVKTNSSGTTKSTLNQFFKKKFELKRIEVGRS
jgi:hypothetical protein